MFQADNAPGIPSSEGFPFHGTARSLDPACPPGVGSSGAAVPDDPWPAFRAFPSVEVRCFRRQSRFPPDPPRDVFPLQGSTPPDRPPGFPGGSSPGLGCGATGAPKHPCLSSPVLRSLSNRGPDRLREAGRPSWGWCTSFRRCPEERAGCRCRNGLSGPRTHPTPGPGAVPGSSRAASFFPSEPGNPLGRNGEPGFLQDACEATNPTRPSAHGWRSGDLWRSLWRMVKYGGGRPSPVVSTSGTRSGQGIQPTRVGPRAKDSPLWRTPCAQVFHRRVQGYRRSLASSARRLRSPLSSSTWAEMASGRNRWTR